MINYFNKFVIDYWTLVEGGKLIIWEVKLHHPQNLKQ